MLRSPAWGENGAPLNQPSTHESVIDVRQGARAPIPPSPAPAGDADAQFASCLMGEGGLYGLLAWDGPEPLALEANGWDASTAVVANPSNGRPQHQLTLRSDRDRWAPVPVTGNPVASSSTPACSPSGFVVVDGAASALVEPDDDSARIKPVKGLPEGADQVVVRSSLDVAAPPLALVVQPPTAESPDSPQPTPLLTLDEDGWAPHGDVGFNERWRGLATKDLVVSLVPDANNDLIEAVRIEVR